MKQLLIRILKHGLEPVGVAGQTADVLACAVDILHSEPEVAPYVVERIGHYVLGIAVSGSVHFQPCLELRAAIRARHEKVGREIILQSGCPACHTGGFKFARAGQARGRSQVLRGR